jgi:2-polyprenyl-3-methyl-5-hydroxy-6-metoxy-1,4-benzoquinol methylase
MNTTISHTKCPGCYSNNIYKVLTVSDFTVSKDSFDIYECGNCTLRFTQNVADEAHIGKYYQSAEYVSHSNTNKGIINKLYHLVRRKTLQQKQKLIERQTKLKTGYLLDVGAGTGAFLHTMKQAGWDVVGLEPDEIARTNAEQLHQLTLLPPNKLFSFSAKQFDTVTLWHVLEHVHRLHDYMQAFFNILKPNGVLVIAVPNYTSYDAAVYKKFWAAYDVPRHLYHFSPQSMEALSTQHGFKIVQHLPMKYDSYYVSMLSEKYVRGKNNYLSAFLTGRKSNSKAKGDAKKYSSVIYVLRKDR